MVHQPWCVCFVRGRLGLQAAVTSLGFTHQRTDTANAFFVRLDFIKGPPVGTGQLGATVHRGTVAPAPALTACKYKKR